MTRAEIVSLLALLVSIASFCSSVLFGLRDRGRLITASKFFPYWEGNPAHVLISVVNAGRRPVILRMWAGAESKRSWVGTYLGDQKSGMRLGEHERHEFKLEKHDLLVATPDEDVLIEDLWFEDTLGRRHIVAGAKGNLAKLWAT